MSYSIRPTVRKMVPYSPGKPVSEVQRELGLDHIVKLASNENPLGPSPLAVQAVRKAAERLHVYPDGAAYSLKQAIADKFGVPTGQVIVGNGSDELIHLLGLVFLEGEGHEIVVGDPSFVRYDAAAHLGNAGLIKVPLDAGFRHDLPAMARAVNDRTRMVFIANPNNPTGTIVGKTELQSFLDDLPPHVVTVLDEAYFEFARAVPEYPNSLDLLRDGYGVIGLRTFSKAYGLAGIRLGYGFAPEEIVDGLDRAREPFNTNDLAQAAGVAALEDDAHVTKTLENNRDGMARLVRCLEAIGARPVPSHANFVFADLGRPARPFFDALLRQGVIVRSGEAFGTPNCVRISIGTEFEMDRLERAIAHVTEVAI